MAELVRIEDFIALALEGKQVNASIELRKKLVSEKVHPGTFEQMKGEVDMYLLFGDYTFTVGKDVKKISKIYMYGSSEESRNEANVNKSIANARLKMDYKRLLDAKIILEERFF
jgi:hypothetical protein